MAEKVHPSEINPGDIVLREVVDYREATDSFRWLPFQVTAVNPSENWIDLAYETGENFGRFAINSTNPNEPLTRLSSFDEQGWWS